MIPQILKTPVTLAQHLAGAAASTGLTVATAIVKKVVRGSRRRPPLRTPRPRPRHRAPCPTWPPWPAPPRPPRRRPRRAPRPRRGPRPRPSRLRRRLPRPRSPRSRRRPKRPPPGRSSLRARPPREGSREEGSRQEGCREEGCREEGPRREEGRTGQAGSDQDGLRHAGPAAEQACGRARRAGGAGAAGQRRLQHRDGRPGLGRLTRGPGCCSAGGGRAPSPGAYPRSRHRDVGWIPPLRGEDLPGDVGPRPCGPPPVTWWMPYGASSRSSAMIAVGQLLGRR